MNILITVWVVIIIGCLIAIVNAYRNKRIDKERASILCTMVAFAAFMFFMIWVMIK